MMKKLSFISIIMIMLTSCEYDYLEPKKIDNNKLISFSSDVIPIFTANCESCHGGSISPDLTETNAYNELLNGSKQYIDTTNAENSLLYTKISVGGAMSVYASTSERSTILQWIQQGAKDN